MIFVNVSAPTPLVARQLTPVQRGGSKLAVLFLK